MATIFQKIFLPKNKIIDIDQKNNIIKMAKATSCVTHFAYLSQNGYLVRHLNITNGTYNMSTERIYDPKKPKEEQIQYSLHVQEQKRTIYATHSQIDKFAERVYHIMYKKWDKKKQHAK